MGKVRWVQAACLVLLLGSGIAQAASHPSARHKPGPVSIRGIATGVGAYRFTLRTARHGDYVVITQGATQVTEKGKSGQTRLQSGDHVSVRGFLAGRTLRAIRIRIYPTKLKPYTLRGTVNAIRGTTIVVAVSGSEVRVLVTSSTRITLGRTTASLGQVRIHNAVRLRVESVKGVLIAISVYVHVARKAARHVRLSGTVVSADRSAIVVGTGSQRYSVAINGGTAVRLGTASVSTSALKPGQSVTVYACCQGGRLTATSIHIRQTAVSRLAILLRGHILAVSRNSLRLSAARGAQTVTLTSSTRFEVGSSQVPSSDIRVGDDVSVRAYRSGSALIAERVHVFASSRRVKGFTGTITAISSSGLTFTSRGVTRYRARVGPNIPIALGGKSVRLTSLRPGDKVRLLGRETAPGVIVASRIEATRSRPRLVTIRGIVVQFSGSSLIIVDATGGRHRVRLASGVRIRLRGKTAPALALFPGVRATGRGRLSGGTLIASSLTLTVTSRSIRGRVSRVSASALVIRVGSSRSIRADFAPGTSAVDGRRRIAPASIHVGAYVRIGGYQESAAALEAVRVSVEHPAIDTAATVVAVGTAIVIQTSAGERYQLRLSAATAIVSSPGHLALRIRDIPKGDHVHVQGTVASDGTLVASSVTVRLASLTIRGTVTILDTRHVTIQTPAGPFEVQTAAGTPVSQGSHELLLSDVVIGDDVTVYGYSVGPASVLARKITVHRRITGLDGAVSALTANGFVLHTPGGDRGVILSPSTIVSGIVLPLTIGVSVHVTGYLRGDGVILATRLRAGKKAPRRAPTPAVRTLGSLGAPT